MTIKKLEAIVTKTFKDLEVNYLNTLDETASYSNLDKEGIINDLTFKIEKIKKEHEPPLQVLPGKCKFCYPEGTAIKFVVPNTEELAIQFVITQEGINEFRIEQCKNNPLPDNDDGLPF